MARFILKRSFNPGALKMISKVAVTVRPDRLELVKGRIDAVGGGILAGDGSPIAGRFAGDGHRFAGLYAGDGRPPCDISLRSLSGTRI